MKVGDIEKQKAVVLERLNHSDLELCTNWGVSAPKPDSKDAFRVGLVVRPELIDVPITIIIKQGVQAREAIEALEYVADIIADANKAVIRHSTVKKTKGLGYFFWLGVHIRAVVKGLFNLPGYFLDWLLNKFKV